MASVKEGKCFCGAVQLTVEGEPAGTGYCHCQSCREWSAAPINAFSLWKTAQVKVVKGEQLIGKFQKTDRSLRQWCTQCGGHLFTSHPHWGLIDVYAAVLPTLQFQPHVHVNYSETVLRVKDGLPKLKGLPKDLGGTGEAVEE